MIPKTIHYCWFGHNEKPPLARKCIDSWRKKCPGYHIIEWNESNFDINCCDYVKEAYEAKKWAFVADYARLWIIYHYGGIYLDTDVEIIKPYDTFLKNQAFFGFERVGLDEEKKCIATGLGFGATANNEVVRRMLSAYDGVHFKIKEGQFDLTTCPIRNTKALEDLLPKKYAYNKVIDIGDAVLYPPEFFCPLDASGKEMNLTENTHSIHWYGASWLSDEEQIIHKYRVLNNKLQRIFGPKLGSYIVRGMYLFKPYERSILKKY